MRYEHTYAHIFKTTNESGLTTAENSDVRSVMKSHHCRRRRPCLLNKITRGSPGAASGDTKAHRQVIKRPSPRQFSRTGHARTGERTIKLRNNCLLLFCCYLIFSWIGQRGPIETSSSNTSDPGPK